MRRARLLATVAVALMAGGCGTAASVTRTAAPPIPAAAMDRGPTGPTAATVASTFADAYARYLDGRVPAAALPDASAAALAQVGPVITSTDRAGELVVQSVSQTSGTPMFTTRLHDRAHTFSALLTLGRAAGRWVVIAVTAPDLDSILHAHGAPIRQPAGSAPAERAARTFMTGYLPWLYGAGAVGTIHGATRALTAELRANPPRIPPTFHGLHPGLASIGMQRHGVGWRAYALVTDGRETYTLVVAVEQLNGRWLVSSVGLPG